MAGVTYDAGALIAAERDDREMWALHVGFLDEGIVPVVPATVLAQTWRGGAGRQAGLARFVRACDIDALSEARAKGVGELARHAGLSDVVDLSVVECARRHDNAIVTSDRGDIESIAQAVGWHAVVHPV